MTPPPLASGLWSVLATPFDAAGGLDTGSLTRQVRAFAEAGADGLVALGVFGEAASLTTEELATVTRVVGDESALPLVIGLPGHDTPAVLDQAETVLGASVRPVQAFMVQINSSDPRAVAEHLRVLHAATGCPVLLQDYPVASGVHADPATVAAIVDACADFVVGVKAECVPTSSTIATLTALTDLPVFGGLGGVGLIDELISGAAGAMTGFSHPEALRATLDAARAGGTTAAQATWGPWLPLANFEGQPGIGLAVRKEILRRRGLIAAGTVRPPAPSLPPGLRRHLDHHLTHLPALQEA